MMINAIARRIKRLENLETQQRDESSPDLVTMLVERRRKRAIAAGRVPEPERPSEYFPRRFRDIAARTFSVADVILAARKRRLLKGTITT